MFDYDWFGLSVKPIRLAMSPGWVESLDNHALDYLTHCLYQTLRYLVYLAYCFHFALEKKKGKKQT